MYERERSMLTEGATQLGITLTTEAIEKFIIFMEMLIDWNTRVNLTAIKQPEDIITKHFLDSLTVLKVIDSSAKKIVDVGTGAGFPGLPMLIARPDLDMLFVDATLKKLKFIEAVGNALGIETKTAHVYVDETQAQAKSIQTGDFDAATARAVRHLPQLLEWTLPFVKKGGSVYAMKGNTAFEEANIAQRIAKKLGAVIGEPVEFSIPFTDIKHYIVPIKK